MSAIHMARNTLQLMRCHQWIKNFFVFATPLFAKQLGESAQLQATVATFFAYCLLSSAVYVMNDLVDLKRDQMHPTKKDRPLAAGRLGIPYAIGLMGVLFCAALTLGAAISTGVLAVLAGYALVNLLYSYVLKYVVIIDVAFIALGFLMRITAGALATDTLPSFWLLLCTVNVSLFLGFAKRRAEVVTLGQRKEEHREVLAHYSEGFLDQMISIVTTTTLVCYILYTVDSETVAYFGTHALVLTVPFVMYGIFRYLYLTYHLQEGGSPTKAVLMDPSFLLNNALWGLTCIVIIYWGDQLNISDWMLGNGTK